MRAAYRSAMDALYFVCAGVAGVSMVLISAIVPWGVFTRYGLNSASSWPEPAAILLSIVLTFFGAAACYRMGLHMRVSFVRDQMPPALAKLADIVAELLMLLVGGFMLTHGWGLCMTTWNQSIAEFPALSVGTSPKWTDVGSTAEGVFLGIMPGTELPPRLPQHPECDTKQTQVQGTFDGHPSRTVLFTDCPGGVTVERVVQLAENRLLWVQVRSATRATANLVLDDVQARGF